MDPFLPSFTDVETGYTPTEPSDASFRDLSCVDNLDTPTPISHMDYLAYVDQPEGPRIPSTSAATTPVQQRSQQADLLVSNIKTEESVCQEPRPLLIYDQSTAGSEARPFTLSTQYQMPTYYAHAPQDACCSLRPSQSYPRQVIGEGIAHYELSVPMQIESGSSFTPSAAPPVPSCSSAVYTHLQPVRLTVSVEPCALEHGSGTLFEATNNPRRYSMPQALSMYEEPQSLRHPSPIQPTPAQFSGCSTPLFNPSVKPDQAASRESRPVDTFIDPTSVSGACGASSSRARIEPATLKEKQFLCNIGSCEKRFARVDELKRHQRTHSDYRPYCCDTCNKAFTRSDHLITHRRTHTGEKPYQCPHCDRRFARSDERSRHIKTHTNPRFQQGRGRRLGGVSGASRQRQPPNPQQQQQQHQQQQQTPKGDPTDEGGCGSSTPYSHS
ncbi:hypothetical protein AAHC03_025818 [Spirometra sp. Aus1]